MKPARQHRVLPVAAALAATIAACGSSPPELRAPVSQAASGNPLGPSYVLIPLPTEDDSLLGRILPELPRPGRSLEETARANPCAEFLTEPRETRLDSSFSYAEELTGEASASAILSSFGFSADASRATHFIYQLDTRRRLGLVDTAEYDACCRDVGCGYGYVSALIYGEGEYATGEETGASASGGVPLVASASGGVSLNILHKRRVRGWLAAVVTVTEQTTNGVQLGALSLPTARAMANESANQAAMMAVAQEKVMVTRVGGGHFAYASGQGLLTEPEFARAYKRVTGSSELDHLDRRRNWAGLIVWNTLTLGSIACTAATVGVGAANDDFALAIIGGSTCGTLALTLLPFAIVSIASPEGFYPDYTEHELTEREARIYTIRYNREVIKHTLEEMRAIEEEASIEIEPVVGPTGLGLRGRF